MTDDFFPGEYVFCPMCGGRLEPAHRQGRRRMSCAACGWVHYRDPAVGAAVVVRDGEGRILLVRRGPTSTQPGRWCIPCGFVDYGEDVRDAALRELEEETGVRARLGRVMQVRSNSHDPAKLSVGVWFEAVDFAGVPRPGDDAVAAGWFALDDLPDLAFDTDAALLWELAQSGDHIPSSDQPAEGRKDTIEP
ncbi:MAG: NUDIX domain-containing protein [Acidimicrobiia bacterium]|nr:NUDIX domain-containing protein [Acidimicrobiia bacterium]MDH4308147.1 NUDIX domain-containing protein [Acidimicrobiia bacterium]MDH5293334.1 NUDIX domain-containing protein [Acidimicrobiia bacterium]